MKIEYLADHPGHVPELARLHFAEWNHFHPEESLDERIERLRSSCGHNAVPSVVVAHRGGELLGSASLVKHDMEDHLELTPWLAGVFVKPDLRGQGIGSALVIRIEDEARSLGIGMLYLYTPSAAALYKRLGWSTMKQCKYKGTDVEIMSKPLIP